MNNYRYIYFEIHSEIDKCIDTGLSNQTRTIKNENFLLLKPENLNSSGYWGFTNMTTRKIKNNMIERTLVVEQYWIDSEIYDFNTISPLKDMTLKVLRKLESKKRDDKLNKIL